MIYINTVRVNIHIQLKTEFFSQGVRAGAHVLHCFLRRDALWSPAEACFSSQGPSTPCWYGQTASYSRSRRSEAPSKLHLNPFLTQP